MNRDTHGVIRAEPHQNLIRLCRLNHQAQAQSFFRVLYWHCLTFVTYSLLAVQSGGKQIVHMCKCGAAVHNMFQAVVLPY